MIPADLVRLVYLNIAIVNAKNGIENLEEVSKRVYPISPPDPSKLIAIMTKEANSILERSL